MFKVIPIGTNGLYPEKDRPTSSYLVIVGEKKIVLDLGSGSFPALSGYIKPEDIDAIVISHFHLDHCADLGVFGYYMQNSPVKIRLFCPDDAAAKEFFKPERFFDVTYIDKDRSGIDLYGVKLSFIEVRHPIKTFAVKIGYEDKTLAYSADTNLSPCCDKIFYGSDLVICDSAFLHSDWSDLKPHLSARLCAELSAKYRVRTLLTHVDPKTDKQAVLKEANEYSSFCSLIENGKEYNV